MQRQLCPQLLSQLSELEAQIHLWERLMGEMCPEVNLEELLIDLINRKHGSAGSN